MASKVRVVVPRDNFAERAYAVSVLFVDILGVETCIEAGDVAHYEICVNGYKRMLVRDHFFGRFPEDHSYLSRDALPTDLATCDAPWSQSLVSQFSLAAVITLTQMASLRWMQISLHRRSFFSQDGKSSFSQIKTSMVACLPAVKVPLYMASTTARLSMNMQRH